MQTALFTKILGDLPLHEACEVAAEIDYDGVEPMGREPHLGVETTDEEADRLRTLLDDLGLEIPCLATYTGSYVGKDREACEDELAKLERFCELADILGVDLVRQFPGGPSPYEATDEQYEKSARWTRRAADLAAEYDKRLAVEIHGNTIVESADDAVRLLGLVNRKNVGAIHDAGNMYLCDEPYGSDTVERLGDRLFHVHVKDERRVEDADGPGRFEREREDCTRCYEPALLGDGDVDHGPLFRALRDGGYDGFLTDECHVPQDDERDGVDVARHEHAALVRALDDA